MNASSSSSAHEADFDLNEAPVRVVPVRRRVDAGHTAPELQRPNVPDALESDHIVPLADGAEPADATQAEEDGAEYLSDLLELELPSQELLAAAACQTAEAEREHLQLQIAQLASHLRERLREVDRREGQINARAAQLEAEERATSLWLRERESQFQQREADLLDQIAELNDRLKMYAALREPAVNPRQADLDQRERQLDEREQELVAREQALAIKQHELAAGEEHIQQRLNEVEQQAAALQSAHEASEAERSRASQELADRWRRLDEAQERVRIDSAQLAEREAELQAAQERLHRQRQVLEQEAADLEADRNAWATKRLEQERALAERRKALEAEVNDRRLLLESRWEWIERQRASLEQVRSEILQLHRQSLEMRLLAEQLWAQLNSSMTPAEVTHQIAQLKVKLSEQYRLEEDSLAERKKELVELSERIARQYDELSQLRSGLREWVVARQAEIEQQAAELVAREQALDERHAQLRRERQKWQSEQWQAELAREHVLS